MEMAVITGMHAVVYTRDVEADRAFFKDVLGFSAVDAGGGWLIFAAPPSELACHPAESNGRHELYLMCDDLRAEMARLAEKGIACGPVSKERWACCRPFAFQAAAISGFTSRITQQPIGRVIEPASIATSVSVRLVWDTCPLRHSPSRMELAQAMGDVRNDGTVLADARPICRRA
jgi:hypothetical protein